MQKFRWEHLNPFCISICLMFRQRGGPRYLPWMQQQQLERIHWTPTLSCILFGGNFRLQIINFLLTSVLITDLFFLNDLHMGNVPKRAKKDTCRRGRYYQQQHTLFSILFYFQLFIKQQILGIPPAPTATTSSDYRITALQESAWEGRISQCCRVQLCSASRSLHPTAVMRAAPLPLPSSERRNVTSHLGASSFTVWCMNFEKLQKTRQGRFSSHLSPGSQTETSLHISQIVTKGSC